MFHNKKPRNLYVTCYCYDSEIRKLRKDKHETKIGGKINGYGNFFTEIS
jgi:hypothetical protein